MALLRAGAVAGGQLAIEAKQRPEGLTSYFVWLAREHPALYTGLVAHSLPRRPAEPEAEAIEKTFRTIDEVRTALAERGLPMPDVFALPYRNEPIAISLRNVFALSAIMLCTVAGNAKADERPFDAKAAPFRFESVGFPKEYR
jgi:hypothetical protein